MFDWHNLLLISTVSKEKFRISLDISDILNK